MRRMIRCVVAVLGWTVVAASTAAAQDFPDENRKQLVDILGGPFLVFRDKAMDDLKITDDQKPKLFQRFAEQVMESGPFFESLQNEKPEDRDKKMADHRQKAHENLASFLKENLQPEQIKRLRQITIRHEGLFGSAQADIAEIFKELKITPDQQKKITALGQEVPRLVQKAVAGSPENAPKALKKIRRDQNQKIEAVLTETQKKKWQEIIGKSFELED